LTTADTPLRARRFAYGPLDIDEAVGVLTCNYDLDGRRFSEVVDVGAGHEWGPAAREAARLVHLLAGVSYYKAGAPPEVDLGQMVVRPGEREFLRGFYVNGLGEFAVRNRLPLDDLKVVGGNEEEGPVVTSTGLERPLVPFGGGIDSIVTVETVRQAYPDTALFVASARGVPRFSAIERAATATGLPVVRAERQVDKALLSSPGPVFNGHVPVTGILSAIAVLCAVLNARGQVVMSNEWSASRGNLSTPERVVNHQWSKSDEFENEFRLVLKGALGPAVEYFSLLRPFSELWVAERFAKLERYHGVVHSCNRAFHMDPRKRLEHWCGRCDKCCFIDLILSPFMEKARLERIFGGTEPLDDPTLLPRFRALLGLGDARKPFECVGDAEECSSAAALAAYRADRTGNQVLARLLGELGGPISASSAREAAGQLLRPLGDHSIPSALYSTALR
jgi:hypothetical protein